MERTGGIGCGPIGIAAAIVLGTLCVHRLSQLPDPLAIALLGAAGLAAVGFAARMRSFVATALALTGVAAIAFASGSGRAHVAMSQRLAPALEGVDLRVTGVVDELPALVERGARLRLRIESCETVAPAQARCALPPRIEVFWFALHRRVAAQPAQRWQLVVRLRRPHASSNPHGFDRELRWLEEGIGAVGAVRGTPRLLDERVLQVGPLIERLRGRIRDAVVAASPPQRGRETGVLVALAVGDQASIEASLWEVFNRTGVSHLMSISGLHITMLCGLAAWLSDRAWRSRPIGRLGWALWLPAAKLRLAVAVTVAFGYSLLAGWGIPAQRTCWMVSVAAALLWSGRALSLPRSVAIAAAVITLLDPWAPLAAGFWLSFMSVVAIVWVATGVRTGRNDWRAVLRSAVQTQWAATVALLPLGALFFGAVSLVGPLANAVAIPLVSAIVTPGALAAAALALLSPALAAWLLWPLAEVMRWLLWSLQALSGLELSVWTVARPAPVLLALAGAGAVLLLAPSGYPRRWLSVLALLPLLALPEPRPPVGEIRLFAFDVGQGMAVLIETPQGRLLYDTGPGWGDSDAGRRVILPYLRARGIRRLDALVVSHLDLDHSGGARSLIELARPERVWSSLPPQHPIVRNARRHDVCRDGERFEWGEIRFAWLHPPEQPDTAERSPTNAASCVLSIRAPGGSVLLPGDIEAAQERRLLARHGAQALRSDVLIAPHHGSATSSSADFLDAVAPQWAIFQVGYRNRFRHPHPKVVARYEQRGIGVLRSDRDGAIELRLRSGEPIAVVRHRFDAPPYWRVQVDP